MSSGPAHDVVRARVTVSGRVQGVEVAFQGSREAVEGMIDWCGSGPRDAHVTGVDVVWEQPRPDEHSFAVTW
jgi:acylphosphatase